MRGAPGEPARRQGPRMRKAGLASPPLLCLWRRRASPVARSTRVSLAAKAECPLSARTRLCRLCEAHHSTPIGLASNVSEPTIVELSIEHDAALISAAPRDSCEQAGLTEVDEQSLTRSGQVPPLQSRSSFGDIGDED